jgi:hypothetical protein
MEIGRYFTMLKRYVIFPNCKEIKYHWWGWVMNNNANIKDVTHAEGFYENIYTAQILYMCVKKNPQRLTL